MNSISEDDIYRLKLIIKLLKDYEERKEKISDLPFKLRSIYSLITTIEQIEVQKIFEHWGEIEEIYAWMISEEQTKLSKVEEIKIKNIIISLNDYIIFLLKKYS